MHPDDKMLLKEFESMLDDSNEIIDNIIPIMEYNHRDFIIGEVRRARLEALNYPSPANQIALLIWLETLVHVLDKDAAQDIKISA